MSEMTIFQGGNVPAHLRGKGSKFNDKAGQGVEVGASMRALSLSGKIWSVRINKDETRTFKDDRGKNSDEMYVAVVDVRGSKSKRYYPGVYKEGSKDNAPVKCFSIDALTPHESVKSPEHTDCLRCPKNEFGSKGNGKACADYKRAVIANVDCDINPDQSIANARLGDLQLRVDIPATSLTPFGEYADQLGDLDVPMNGLVTRMQFDDESKHPRVLFKAMAYLDEEQSGVIEKMADEADVQKIIAGDQEVAAYKYAHEKDQDEEENVPAQSAPNVQAKGTAPDPAPEAEKESDSGDASKGPSDDTLKGLGVDMDGF